jgi:hypothetical protein
MVSQRLKYSYNLENLSAPMMEDVIGAEVFLGAVSAANTF